MNKYLTSIGYIIFLFGFLSILLSMVGINLRFLAWLENFGRLAAFLIKIGMVIGGLIIMYVSRTAAQEIEVQQKS